MHVKFEAKLAELFKLTMKPLHQLPAKMVALRIMTSHVTLLVVLSQILLAVEDVNAGQD
jgi:hypothetical protein